MKALSSVTKAGMLTGGSFGFFTAVSLSALGLELNGGRLTSALATAAFTLTGSAIGAAMVQIIPKDESAKETNVSDNRPR